MTTYKLLGGKPEPFSSSSRKVCGLDEFDCLAAFEINKAKEANIALDGKINEKEVSYAQDQKSAPKKLESKEKSLIFELEELEDIYDPLPMNWVAMDWTQPQSMSNLYEPLPMFNPSELLSMSNPSEPLSMSNPYEPQCMSNLYEPLPMFNPSEPLSMSNPSEPLSRSNPYEPQSMSNLYEPLPMFNQYDLLSMSNPYEPSNPPEPLSMSDSYELPMSHPYPDSNFHRPALWRAKKRSELATAEVNRQSEHQEIVPNVKRSWRERSYSMIQGKKITITGGKFNNVGGDYHEHNTYVIEESAKRPKYLKRILG